MMRLFFFLTLSFFLFNNCLMAQDTDVAYNAEITLKRKTKDESFKDKNSPLENEQREVFEGLKYFAVNNKYKVAVTFKRTPKEKSFKMPASGSIWQTYVKYGELSFELDGKSHVLTVYQNKDLLKKDKKKYKNYLFIPFKDLTSGHESYGGGRFIEYSIPEAEAKNPVLDFNLAFNPYCSYSNRYSCPIPPKENHLNVKIEAGEKIFEVH